MISWARSRIKYIRIIDVGDTHYKDTHFSHCAVDHAGRDLNHGAGVNRMFLAIEDYGAFPLKHVVEFGGALVVVWPGTINIHGMSPCSGPLVPLADEAIAMPAGATFPWGVTLMAKNNVPGKRGEWFVCHPADCRR